jgi:uncharacterized protein YggT (Ycf19 family)
MALEESEEKTKETQVSQEGDTQIVREKTSASSSAENRLTVINGIWFLVGIFEVLLGFRFVLKLLGANPNSGFTDFVYSVSGPLTAPFRGIFSTPTAEGDITTSVFETSTLIAIVVYAIIGWGIVKLATLNKE